MLIELESDDDWLDCRLQDEPSFVKRVASAQRRLRKGRGVKLEAVKA